MAKPPIRKPKKKVCAFCKDKVSYVDYKDTNLLRKFSAPHGDGYVQSSDVAKPGVTAIRALPGLAVDLSGLFD